MQDLYQRMPQADVLLGLEPQELAGTLIFLIRERCQRLNQDQFHPRNMVQEFERPANGVAFYERTHIHNLKLAVAEALAWLQAQALIIPNPQDTMGAGWMVLSRRARQFEDAAAFRGYATAQRLPREKLDPSIAQSVWSAFIRGEYSAAVFTAMRQVEIAVRVAGGYGDKMIGTDLMRQAFHQESGPLTDKQVVVAEREARQALFAGAIGAYKNPPAHREVNMDDPNEAMEVIMLANHLLRIVSSRAAANAQTKKPAPA